MKLTLVKSRDSENGKTISYQVDLNRGMFTYIPDEEDGLGGESVDNTDYATRYSREPEGEDVF